MDSNTAFVLNEYRAMQSQQQRDYRAAISHSRSAAEAARKSGDALGLCRMEFQTGQLQFDLGLIQDAIATCRRLLNSDAIKQYADFESRTRVLLSRIFHNDGQMHDALKVAREASRIPADDLSLDARRSVQHALVAALAEDGDTEAAWAEAMNLAGMLEGETSYYDLGVAQWTIGNVAFMSARLDEGLAYQSLAMENLSRLDNVNLWAQFNKATAHMRLTAGLTGPETAEFVERAEVAFAVAGGKEIDLYEVRITRAWWELASGNPSTAEELLRPLDKELAGPYPFLQARVLLLLARCFHALGRTGEALRSARQSEGIFIEVGADVFASESRAFVAVLQEAPTS
ncbi:hypothetical protein [Arthrobacter sp. zg-Y877]|uniref:hypothetical protein n=1 Tax=Arthrobacter sp. zg-Y877 TaxID=3049074 RepID=UPI0025A43BBB|nr:hypothetical protein [Arthrobacter sp. zg-Y877]MDM7990470.1 hypothetical protein [Arthrobacter sp. zg-Y877]